MKIFEADICCIEFLGQLKPISKLENVYFLIFDGCDISIHQSQKVNIAIFAILNFFLCDDI